MNCIIFKMVGQMQSLVLEEIFTEKEIHHILRQFVGVDIPWQLKRSEVEPAADGIAGFFGDYMKITVYVDVQGKEKRVHLFLKQIPINNKPKADFINEHNLFKREKLMFKVLDEIYKYDSNPWCVKPYIYTDTMIVMPDISKEGYSHRHFLDVLDTQHTFVCTKSIARFHAAYVNYETQKSIDLKRPYSTAEEFGQILKEPSFYDTPWLRGCSKLSNSLLKTFSTKSYRNLQGLESKLTQLYIDACDTLKEYKETVNALIHKDLWLNNIMFRSVNDIPVGAVLIDYQCLRYGPPAFDLMIFLYLTTDRHFRKEHEKEILDYYYSIFVKNLSEDSKDRLNSLGYDKEDFFKWCEKGRMFGMLVAIGLYPYVLMDPMTAEKTFDHPTTFEKYRVDRSEPVIEFANTCETYKQRNLQLTEEFVETYVLGQL